MLRVIPARGDIRWRHPAGRPDAPWRFSRVVELLTDRHGTEILLFVRHWNEEGNLHPEVFQITVRTGKGAWLVDVQPLKQHHESEHFAG